jgi:dTDP-4-amino-4,6-dideoxygalactose transaminase
MKTTKTVTGRKAQGGKGAAGAVKLALHGGPKAMASEPPEELFHWPIVTAEDEEAVVAVLRKGNMSGNDLTKLFEQEFAAWIGMKHALAYPNGTDALRAAMWACGVGAGDEIICPSITYWASCTQALTLGASVNFADIDPDSLCIAPSDIEHRIGPRTKAVVVVHYAGYPCDMDPIMEIARRRKLWVIEDVSHAQGTLYKGRLVGTFGDIAAMSMMAGKSFAIGEGGMLVTNDRRLYERCISYGFYERTGVETRWNAPDAQVTLAELKPYVGIPMGGYKHRLNQTCAAMGRVQLKHYPARIKVIQDAMNRFWDLLEGVPGIRAHRPAKGAGSTMGGWYAARGLYRAEELGGLPSAKFCEAVRAEGVACCRPGANSPLHVHPLFHTADIFNMGQPTMLSFGQRDVRQGPGTLPVSERIMEIAYTVPWFKHDRPEFIKAFADAYRKVAENADRLL